MGRLGVLWPSRGVSGCNRVFCGVMRCLGV